MLRDDWLQYPHGSDALGVHLTAIGKKVWDRWYAPGTRHHPQYSPNRKGAFEPGGTDAPGPAPLRARVDEIEMDVAALYAEIEELHRKVDAP